MGGVILFVLRINEKLHGVALFVVDIVIIAQPEKLSKDKRILRVKYGLFHSGDLIKRD